MFACVTYTETLDVADPLPSWNDSATRQEIVGFVEKTTTELKIPELGFYDDKEGKPVAIHRHIGRQPTMAFGNSDGDFQMLEWSTAGGGPRLGVVVHHDDADREWAYDRDSHIGKLVRGLDEGPDRGWVIISMKDDWRQVIADQVRLVFNC